MLLVRVLDNLLSNAVRVGDKVKVNVTGKKLKVINNGPPIEKEKLRKLNKGKKLSPQEYEGSGQGLRICHDVARLHEASLSIESSEDATIVSVEFFH